MTDYLSVSEYARLHGKDPGNIRRLLSAGRLQGQKVGKQWIIPCNAPYLKDRRASGSKCRRAKTHTVLKEHKELMNTINSMIDALKNIYGDLLYEVILYGSYARGTQTAKSDVDIAVMLFSKTPRNITDKMIDCVAGHELECGKVLSVIDVNCTAYSKWNDVLPFYRNIDIEGIVLWTAGSSNS